jgi:hypothetical protein
MQSLDKAYEAVLNGLRVLEQMPPVDVESEELAHLVASLKASETHLAQQLKNLPTMMGFPSLDVAKRDRPDDLSTLSPEEWLNTETRLNYKKMKLT